VAGGGEDEGDRIAGSAGEDVAAEMAAPLHLADRRLDAGTSPDFAADGGRHTSLLPGEEDAALAGFARPAVFGVVAAVAAIDRGALAGDAGDALGLGDLGGRRVAVAGIARQGARAEHDRSARHWTVGGVERLGEQQFKPVGAIALAPAGHRGAVARQGVLDVALAAAELDRGAVEEAGADGRIGEAVPMLVAREKPRTPRNALAFGDLQVFAFARSLSATGEKLANPRSR
jgi:hypothetical protein